MSTANSYSSLAPFNVKVKSFRFNLDKILGLSMFKKSQSNKVHIDCFLHEHRSEKTSVCKSDKHLQYQALSICRLYIFCQLLNLQESSEWTSLFACRSRIACNNVHLHLAKFLGLLCNQSIYCRAMCKYIPCLNIHCTPTCCLFQ